MRSSASVSTPDEQAASALESEGAAEPPNYSTRSKYISKRFVNQAGYIRLRSDIVVAHHEFERLVERADADGEQWVKRGRELIEMTVSALDRGAVEEGWRYLHAAKRLEIYGLEQIDRTQREENGPSELEIRAAVVRDEALENLEGWRREAVVDLLCDESENLKSELSGSALREASRLLHGHYESIYLLRSERQRQFNQLVGMGVFSGLSLFVLTLMDWLWDESSGLFGLVGDFLETPFGPGEIAITAPGFAVFVTIAGVMGASLFGMRSLRKQSLSMKIPQQINQLTVTGARGVIGAISALLFYFVLQTSLLKGGTILAEDLFTPPAIVVVGFAAGYTERMVPSVVAKVASITDSEENNENDK